jgi:hypothetical protein
MNSAIVSFNQHYGKRAFAAINTMGVSALVYFRKDVEAVEVDPMVQKMQGFA